MEKPEQRDKYIAAYKEFSDLVDIQNQQFINLLENHKTFGRYMAMVKNQGLSEERKKDFVLLEFTRMRWTCNQLIKLLQDSGQTVAAERLLIFNKSPGRLTFPQYINIWVPVRAARCEMEGSLMYTMNLRCRGRAIIINNEPDVNLESKRFGYIFTELLFNVDLYYKWTALEIQQNLVKIREQLKSDINNQKDIQCLIVMVITHGQNEQLLGSQACEDMRLGIQNNTDLVNISDIEDIFSKTNFPTPKLLPKLLFFTCCRDKTPGAIQSASTATTTTTNTATNANPLPTSGVNQSSITTTTIAQIPGLKTVQQNDFNLDTFVSYSCTEGYKTPYNRKTGLTCFGQALSLSIAQYADHLHLLEIMNRTNQALNEECGDNTGHFVPELRLKGLRHNLYFNPKYSI